MLQRKNATINEEKPKNNVEVLTFLGVGTEFRGKVLFKGTLRIDGFVEGEIEGNDSLMLGESGSINGICKIGKAIISGNIKGEIIASEKIILKPNANVEGKITTPSLIVEEGAVFNGTTRMVKSQGYKSQDN